MRAFKEYLYCLEYGITCGLVKLLHCFEHFQNIITEVCRKLRVGGGICIFENPKNSFNKQLLLIDIEVVEPSVDCIAYDFTLFIGVRPFNEMVGTHLPAERIMLLQSLLNTLDGNVVF